MNKSSTDFFDGTGIITSQRSCSQTPVEIEIPTKLSELENDMGFISDKQYQHTDNNYTDEDKAIVAGASKINQVIAEAEAATINSIQATAESREATSISKELSDNPMRIIEGNWWSYNLTTKKYEDTGIKATGDSFVIRRTYPSVQAMQDDFETTSVEVGQFVVIDSSVEDPDNSRMYMKTETEWKYITDLSGAQGITGLSAYQIAVQHGFVGTEEEWVKSLSQASEDAAKLANEATENAKAITATMIQLQESVEAAETIRENQEAARETNTAKIISDTTTKALLAEQKAALADQKATLADTAATNANDAAKSANDAAGTVGAAVDNANTAATNANEKAVLAEEAAKSANDAAASVNEAKEAATTAAALANEKAELAAQKAELANTSATNASTQATRAKEYADNPPKIENDNWWVYDDTTKAYVDTNVKAKGTVPAITATVNNVPHGTDPTVVKTGTDEAPNFEFNLPEGPTGEPGKSPKIQDGTWWVWDIETRAYVNTNVSVSSDYELTKAKVENVLTGTITSHNHDDQYYTEAEINQKLADIASKSVVIDLDALTAPDPAIYTAIHQALTDSTELIFKFESVYYKGNVLAGTDSYKVILLPIVKEESNSTNKLTQLEWTILLDGSFTKNSYSVEDSRINTISARGEELPIVNKGVTIPDDVAISPSEPTGDERIWIDTDENYGFNYDGYTKIEANNKFVAKEPGKGLSRNDYTDEDKLAVGTIGNKVEKVEGKQLSTEDYTTAEKTKLQGVAANANNYVHPTTAGNKHIPAGGTAGQILVNNGDGTAEWQDNQGGGGGIDYTGLEDIYSYGVEWDSTVADPTLTRIGNPLLHKSLPIQSQYKGCVANGAEINYYLNPNDWSQKADGTPSVLDGTDGTVRVHIPKFYGKSGVEGTKRWVRMSTIKMDNTWIEIPEMLVDAYRSTVNQTGNKAVSVVNTTAQFRGGGNRTANDTYLDTDAFRSDLGKPRTNILRANMRTYATNAGSEMLCYEYYKWIFYWAWVVEYATLNSQKAYTADLTAEGYHQGGLGDGVTTWNGDWNTYNGYYPLTPCGYCNDIGNFTGVKDLVIPETVINESTTVTSKTFKVPRWRGFDNPFGDIWTNLDGIILERTAANQPSSVYTTTDPTAFGDDNTAKGKMTVAGTEIASDGWIKDYDLGETGEIIPSVVGGSATTYMCDYHYCNAGSTALRTLFVGGGADYGCAAGLGCFYSYYGVGYAYATVGFRTLNKVV